MTAAACGRSARPAPDDARSRLGPVGKLYIADLMHARVACHDEPRAASTAVIPELLMNAGRIVAQINVIVERLACAGRRRIGPPHGRVAEIGELVVSARTAVG